VTGEPARDPTAVRRSPLVGLLSAATVSVFGIAMSALAIPWLVLTMTGSAVDTGLVAFAELGPYVLLQVLIGPVVDRVGARKACMWGNAVAAAAICVIPVLSATGSIHLVLVVAVVVVVGSARGIADCATTVLVPGTAASAGVSLERAAGMFAGATRAGQLLGPPAAGVLVAAVGSPTVILVNGVTFAAAAVLIAALVPGSALVSGSAQLPTAAVGARRQSYGGQLSEGLRFLRADRLLLGIVAVIAVTNLLDQGMNSVLIPVWIRQGGHSPAALGLIAGAMGGGALVGNLVGAWLGPRLPRRLTLTIGLIFGCAPRYAVLALASTFPPILVVTVLAGCVGGAINPIIGAVLYERVPPRLQARVLGTVKASAWIGMPFGALFAGLLSGTVGLRAALLGAAAVALIVTAAPLFFPAWKDLGRARGPAEPPPREADAEPVAPEHNLPGPGR